MHIQPTALDAPIATMAVGDSAIFRFRISVEQVETMFGWTERRWHPCVLAVVNASNDHAFNSATSTGGALIMRRNNLAQRNLSVIRVPEGEMRSMPFMAGSESSGDELFDLVIRIERLSANDAVYLSLDTDTTSPSPPREGNQDDSGCCSGQGNWKFVDRTRIETDLCGCRAVLTFEKGSEVDFWHPAPRIVSVKGGKIETREEAERIRVTDTTMVVRFRKASFRAIPLLLQAEIANKLQVDIAQRNLAGKVVGGVMAQFVKA